MYQYREEEQDKKKPLTRRSEQNQENQGLHGDSRLNVRESCTLTLYIHLSCGVYEFWEMAIWQKGTERP